MITTDHTEDAQLREAAAGFLDCLLDCSTEDQIDQILYLMEGGKQGLLDSLDSLDSLD